MAEIVLNKCISTEGDPNDLDYAISFNCSLIEDATLTNRCYHSLPCSLCCYSLHNVLSNEVDVDAFGYETIHFEKIRSPLFKVVCHPYHHTKFNYV